MTELPTIRGKHGEYPVHLSMGGRERFPKSFCISLDVGRGEMTFTGIIGDERITMFERVLE